MKSADDPFYRELGQRVRGFRAKCGLTQDSLGKMLNPQVTRAAIANVENGKQRVLAHTVAQLAQVLDVEVGLLLPIPDQAEPDVKPKALEQELMKKLDVSAAALKRLSTHFRVEP
ncbi:MAG: hypothetical protein ABS36_05235 [Acidobacteria bacterium SCN 69-37]|nr:MAG: hypothetical protein ABS36_05235 [Acidobacteria bacterium SCN 69-37]